MLNRLRKSEWLRSDGKRSLKLPLMLLIVVVLLLAWMMFVVHLDYESMWSDEWFSWMYAVEGPFRLVRDTANDVHPPFYYLVLWAWVTITGNQSLFVMRLTAAFPALLTVALSYRLAVEWFKSHWTGIAAAAFLGTSGIFVYYARELRMYALTVTLVMLSWWFLTRFLRGRKGSLVGYTACVALMAYTYYFSAFVLFAQIIIVIWFYRDKLSRLLLAYAAVLAAFLPWVPTVLDQIFWARARAGNPNAPLIGKFGATSPTTLPNIANFINTYTAKQPAFAALLIVLAFGLGWGVTRRVRWRHWLIALALWLFLSSALMFGLNLVFPIYNQRYLLPIIPALALVAGVAVGVLAQRQIRLGAALIGVIAVSGMLLHADAFLEPKTPHRDMLKTIAAEYRPGDRIWYNFSYGGLGSSLAGEVSYHLKFDAPELSSDDFIWDAPHDYQGVRRVWDVRPYWIPIPDQALAPLMADRVLSEDYIFGAYDVRLYEAPPADDNLVKVGNLFEMLPDGVQKTSYHPGDTLVAATWWRTIQQPTLDYSYVLYLEPDGRDSVIAQHDAGLIAGKTPTSQWTPDQPYRLAQLQLDLPADLTPGDYDLWVGVYFWQNPQRLAMQTDGDTPVSADDLTAMIGKVTILR